MVGMREVNNGHFQEINLMKEIKVVQQVLRPLRALGTTPERAHFEQKLEALQQRVRQATPLAARRAALEKQAMRADQPTLRSPEFEALFLLTDLEQWRYRAEPPR